MKSPSEEAPGTTSIMTQGGFQFYTVMERGMTFKPETPKELWLEAVRKLLGMYEGATITRERALMMLADALNFGYDAYGEKFSQAIDGARSALGLTPKTIANAQWVYKSIEPYRRRDELTLAHYSVIAGFDANEQEQFIATALCGLAPCACTAHHMGSTHPCHVSPSRRGDGSVCTDDQLPPSPLVGALCHRGRTARVCAVVSTFAPLVGDAAVELGDVAHDFQ